VSLECTAVQVHVLTRVHAASYKWQRRIFPRLRFCLAHHHLPLIHSLHLRTQFGPKFLLWIHGLLRSLQIGWFPVSLRVNRKKNCVTVGRSWFLTFVGFAEEKWEKFRWFSLQSRGSSAAAAAVVKLHAEFIQARDTILSLSNLLIAHGIDQ